MNLVKKYGLQVVALVIAIIAVISSSLAPGVKTGSTSTTNLTNYALGGLEVGSGCDTSYGTCTGTYISRINTGTCYIFPYATTITATSTAVVDCQARAAIGAPNSGSSTALTGVTYGDNVVATLSTSTSGTTMTGLSIIGASASSTAGFITFVISNQTGTTFTWPVTGTASGTASYIVTK